METRRWLNQSQPQTLVIAVMLLYLDAVFIALSGGIFSGLGLIIIVGSVAAGYGIANERKWGYYLGVAAAALPLIGDVALCIQYQISPFRLDLINLLFQVALFVLLVHPMSRSYERIWFK